MSVTIDANASDPANRAIVIQPPPRLERWNSRVCSTNKRLRGHRIARARPARHDQKAAMTASAAQSARDEPECQVLRLFSRTGRDDAQARATGRAFDGIAHTSISGPVNGHDSDGVDGRDARSVFETRAPVRPRQRVLRGRLRRAQAGRLLAFGSSEGAGGGGPLTDGCGPPAAVPRLLRGANG